MFFQQVSALTNISWFRKECSKSFLLWKEAHRKPNWSIFQGARAFMVWDYTSLPVGIGGAIRWKNKANQPSSQEKRSSDMSPKGFVRFLRPRPWQSSALSILGASGRVLVHLPQNAKADRYHLNSLDYTSPFYILGITVAAVKVAVRENIVLAIFAD